MRWTLVVVIALFTVTTAATAQVGSEPRFEAFTPNPRLDPGSSQTVTVELTNDAESAGVRVKTATTVRVTARPGSTPFDVISGSQFVGRMADGDVRSLAVELEVPADVAAGSYRVPLDISYEFENARRRTTTVYAELIVPDRPVVSVESVSSDVFLEETGRVRVSMRNVGSEVARAATVAVSSPNPAVAVGETASSTIHVGDWPPEGTETVVVPMTTMAAASARSYPLELILQYRDARGIQRSGPPASLAAEVSPGNRFTVTDVRGRVPLGETDTVAVSLRNRGNTTVTDASVSLESTSPSLTFGNRTMSREFVGTWEPGETRTISADISAARSGTPRRQSVQAVVAFSFPDGVDSRAGPIEVGVGVTPAQAFTFQDVAVDLRGTSAFLSATVTNEGNRTAHNAVAVLSSTDPAISVVDPTVAMGDLAPGASSPVTFALRIAPDAAPGPRELNARVRYDRGADRSYRTRPEPLVADFQTDRELFTVEPINATLERDASNRLAVRIRNDGDQPLTEVRVRLHVTPPYESQSPTAYVDRLDQGAATTVTFELTTPDDAVPTTDAVSLNLTAKTAADRTIHAGPYVVPFSIPQPGVGGGGVLWLVVGVAVVGALLVSGWWWLNR